MTFTKILETFGIIARYALQPLCSWGSACDQALAPQVVAEAKGKLCNSRRKIYH